MRITKRRKEFLVATVQLFHDKGSPVHYCDVAQELNVSKWTAYDVMKSMETQGLIKSVYSVSSKDSSPGRSSILFYPLPIAYEILGISQKEISKAEEWSKLKGNLLERIAAEKENNFYTLIDEIQKEIKAIEIPLLYGAYMIVLLLSLLVVFSQGNLDNIKTILLLSAKAEIKLLLFVGTALSYILKKDTDIEQYIKKDISIEEIQDRFDNVSSHEKKLLAEFLEEAITAVI